MQGKGYMAIWNRWQKIKNMCPQVARDSEESETSKKGIPAIRQSISHFSHRSEVTVMKMRPNGRKLMRRACLIGSGSRDYVVGDVLAKRLEFFGLRRRGLNQTSS